MRSILAIAVVVFNVSAFAQDNYNQKIVNLNSDAPEVSFKLLQQTVRYSSREICHQEPTTLADGMGGSYQSTVTRCDSVNIPHPQHMLQINGRAKVNFSEVATFNENIDFRLNDQGNLVIDGKSKNILSIESVLKSEDIVGGAVVREVDFGVKIFSRDTLDKMKAEGVKDFRYEAGKLRFRVLALSDAFEIKPNFLYGKNCTTFFPRVRSNTQAITSELIGDHREFTVDFDVLRKEGYRVYRNKICALVSIDAKLKSSGEVINGLENVSFKKMVRP